MEQKTMLIIAAVLIALYFLYMKMKGHGSVAAPATVAP